MEVSFNGPLFNVSFPLAITSLTPNPGPPLTAGTSITWTASATGGVAPLQYRFWRYNASTAGWSIVQDYGSPNGAEYTWTTVPGDAGTYAISVWVRSAGSTASMDASYNGPLFALSNGTPVAITGVT